MWFGETLPTETFQKAIDAFETAQVAFIIGTSAVVEPAASLGRLAAQNGAYVIEINPEETPLSHLAHTSIRKDAVAGLEMLLH